VKLGKQRGFRGYCPVRLIPGSDIQNHDEMKHCKLCANTSIPIYMESNDTAS